MNLTPLIIPNLIAENKCINHYIHQCQGCDGYYVIITQNDVIKLKEKTLLVSGHEFNNSEEAEYCVKELYKNIKQIVEN